MYDLEQNGGSIIGGVLKLLQNRKKNPPPPRDSRLPPKPKGQTVGSFKKGLQSLPQAIADKLSGNIRHVAQLIALLSIILRSQICVAEFAEKLLSSISGKLSQ